MKTSLETADRRPTCIGFIMDGNRRWAREQGLDTLAGHMAGRDTMQSCVEWASQVGIPHVVFYAFSTENWQRSSEEVSYLMQLFAQELQVIAEKAVNVQVVGDRSRFSTELNELIKQAEENNQPEHTTTVWVAVSYGGRAEIIAAVNVAVSAGELVDEDSFARLLWTADMPDPDIIVRTGGEVRLSNFLTWSSTYSELYFVATYWPALTRQDFDDILIEYATRERRRGR